MNTTTLFGAGAVPLIAGIVQAVKMSGLPVRLAPLIALALGIGAGVISVWQTQTPSVSWAAAIVIGITWGLAASGLYQGGKLARGALRSGPSPYAPPGSKAATPTGDVKPATAAPAVVAAQPPVTTK